VALFTDRFTQRAILCVFIIGEDERNHDICIFQFQAPDLAQLAHELDTLEGAVNEDAGPVSNNMDDTGTSTVLMYSSPLVNCIIGFFSVGVLEKAISVWGFT